MTEAYAKVLRVRSPVYEVRWQGATLDAHDSIEAARSQVEAFRAMWQPVDFARASEYCVVEVTITEREVEA